ncbi:filamentous haemagglutinin family protein [Bradyrhizobium roseum]|uniref:filamentous haemagglutinin family protein n=1 Tax=Bradyrhizobium roseum TaxID=3056648 RepID=UPI002615C346|nr:filamentous haemagglutinin family protein [Bradyrhizobium roseus]WKA26110.1 filamentous hemagglutinin family protein [Bradyrhizobium roseus]
MANARSLGAPASPIAAAGAVTAATASQIEAAKIAGRTQAGLKRAMQAMQNAQGAAREAARLQPVVVPNGLRPGGLQVAPGATPSATDGGAGLWQGAKLPTEVTSGGRSNVIVEQTQSKAILTWESFNVGRETDLYFNQTAGGANANQWIALNRVLDPSAAPSRILGTIKAEGQVYVINRNGIIFGGASQVNVGSLVASSLSLSNQQFMAGINSGQLIGPIGGGSDSDVLPTFGDVPRTTNVNALAPAVSGNVEVQAGARIASGKNGLLGLFGTNVTNAGTLATDGGQVMLAAGEQVWLVPNSVDGGMIGMRAYVSALPNYYTPGIFDPALFQSLANRTAQVGMVVTNNGLIAAEAGNITVVGSTVAQNGVIRAITTLDAPGTILIAGEDSFLTGQNGGIKRRGGAVVFGADSVTQIVVDSSNAVGTGGSAGNSSLLRISGKTVELKTKIGAGADELQGAYVQAQAGKIDIDLRATDENFNASAREGFDVQPAAPSAGTRLLMHAGSILDVSGVYEAEVPMERNSVEVEVRANELRDSPLQRDGILKAKKIWVDRRVSGKRADGSTWLGTAVVDANKYIANVPTSMTERAVKGGLVKIHSNEVIVTAGAAINISGGSIRYLDGNIRTTQLVGADGRSYAIGSAPADMDYVGLNSSFTVSHARHNIVETWTSPLGRNRETRFEKGYVEGAAAGSLEIYAKAQVLNGGILADAIVGERQVHAPAAGGSLTIGAISPPDTPFNANDLLLQAQAASLPSNFTMASALPSERVSTLILSTDMLNESGLSKIDIRTDGNKVFASDVDLRLRPGASFSVYSGVPEGRSTTVDGSIRIAGGTVSITGIGNVIVKNSARIDVSGQWSNEMFSLPVSDQARNGGSVTFGAQGTGFRLVFESGSTLAADAGATHGANGKVSIGKAGSITLTSTLAMDLRPVTMSAYGVALSDQVAAAPAGGSLILLNSPAVSIAPGGGAPIGSLITLDPSFFNRGGFSNFSFGLASIQDGVTLAPQVQTKVLSPGYRYRASTESVAAVAAPTMLSDGQRPGVVLNMTTTGNFVLRANTRIGAGIGGSVVINGGTSDVIIAGKIDAPAGSINVTGRNVTVASTAQLLARGATRIVADARGVRSDDVFDGGSVGLTAQNEVITRVGSLIDVSGTSGDIDIIEAHAGLSRPTYKPLTVAGNGGSIVIAGQGLVAGTLVANAGGDGAAGGTLSLNVGSPSNVTVPAVPSTVYYQDANGVWQSRTSAQDLDIFNQFPGAAMPATSITVAERNKVIAAVTGGSGRLLTVFNDDALAPGGAGWENYRVSLQEVDPTITQAALDVFSLYNSIYYIRSGSGTVASPFVYTKMNYNPVITELAVRQSAFQDGGFAGVSLTSSKVGVRFGDGVNIAASRNISVSAPVLTGFSGASASLTAPLVTLSAGKASVAAASRAGMFSVHAQQIEIGGAAFKGFADVALNSTGDLLMSGGTAAAPTSLFVDGALTLNAGQIYPTTLGTAKITATQIINVIQNGARPVAPLSAGGSLTLTAPTIVQSGTMRAPFGQITLDAATSLTLAPGSLTSVSGAGLVVPFGNVVDETLWYTSQSATTPILSPPEKRLTLKAPVIDTQAGSVIDLSGGGDLLAYQFIPGSGGSSDYLTYGGAVAIMPIGMVSNHVGKRIVHLDGGNGIAAGDYVVLPASYALLPGAYRLAPQNASNGQPLYEFSGSARLPDGSILVAGRGYSGGTDISDQRGQAYKVSPIGTTRSRSEYKIWTANEYFRSGNFVEAIRRQQGTEVTAIPRLPMDAGALQIQATLSATLAATLMGSPEAGGRGAAIDISAAKIAVVGGVDAAAYKAAGYLVLDAAQLSAFGGESLLLGGTRLQTVRGLEVDATAISIVVATDGTDRNALIAPEILLASEDSIQIVAGSLIEARGSVAGRSSGDMLIKPAVAAVKDASGNVTTQARDFGALLRLSNGEAVRVIRDGAQTTQGTLTVGGATLRGRALLLDATKSTTVSASAALLAKVLDVSSGRISIGTPPTNPDGLVLSGGSLAALMGATDLRLRSYSSIDFYGEVALGGRNADGTFTLTNLLLDAAALNGSTGSAVTVAGAEVAFTNTLGATNTNLGGVGGSLVVAANTFSFGAGTKAVTGFNTIRISASTAIVGRGTGTTDFAAANLAFDAPRLTAESGASQDWTTAGTFAMTGTPASGGAERLGARLAITASAITQGGLIDLAAGSLSLRATSGDVTLTSGSITRAQGFSRTFYDQQADIAAGTIALTADQGRVWAQAGSLLDVSGSGNGAAGTLSIATPLHEARLDGDLWAGRGGNFTLDASAVSAFGALSGRLRQGGFDGDLGFRLRSGDVVIDGETRARSFTLATDAGGVRVTGTIDVSGAAGGAVRLAARQDLTVVGGAILRANAGSAKESSGLIELVAADGSMDLGAGATIEALGGRNGMGEIRLRFKRDDSDGSAKLVNAAATMTAGRIVAEAYRSYGVTAVDTALPGALADAAGFMSAYAAGIEARLGRSSDPTFHLVPGVELASSGDLTLSTATDLHAARYGGEAGVLTLRAGGNLVLNGSLSDGFASAAMTAAVGTDAASWSYRLVGGADLGAANPMAVRPLAAFADGTSGNIRLGSGTLVRTGTGSITIAAGNDLVLADQTSVIYTAGARVADPSLGGTYTGNVYNPAFTQGGGDVQIRAQNDVKTLVASDQMIIDWLWRMGNSNTTNYPASENNDGAFLSGAQTSWWINFATFQQGVAALGGGNVSLEAGRDVSNVSVSTPTQGRVGGGRTASEAKRLVITGGGDMTVRAGRDVVGGVYYVDHGTGAITAGRAVTSNRTALYSERNVTPVTTRTVPIRTALALGDADLTVIAGGAIDLGAIGNPTLWSQAQGQVGASVRSYFSTYGVDTDLTLLSVGGDVRLWNAALHYQAATPAWQNFSGSSTSAYFTAMRPLVHTPPRIKAIAAAGSITIEGGMVLWPSASGNLDLWAQDSINIKLTGFGTFSGSAYSNLVMSPDDPEKVGSVLRPLKLIVDEKVLWGIPSDYPSGDLWGYFPAGARGDSRPDRLLHQSDFEPSRLYANSGNLTVGSPRMSTAQYYPEQIRIRAGRDINNLQLRAQNIHASDLTLLQAGRDINLGQGPISIDGPGFALVEAGRDVFLGSGAGIQTVGNGETSNGSGNPTTYSNPLLPRQGASLLVLAGTADGPRYDAFIDAYLDPTKAAVRPEYLVSLVSFMRQVTGDPNLSLEAALAAIREPRFADHRKFLVDKVLSRELRAAGRGQLDGLGDQGLGYERGYKALATLFPGAEKAGKTAWQGDVIMQQSMIRTYLGGDVDIVAPGGILQVSALSSNAVGERDGVLTINGGEIRITTGSGAIINKSRVLTARGGDITIWSTYGDIDAGKGRKSSLTTPPTTYSLSPDGNISYRVNPNFAGSGISTQQGAPDAPLSDVDLYAPSGTINAGDAGIRVSGSIYLGALQILGAENIHAGGAIKGLPKATADSVPLMVETKDKAASDALKDATQAAPPERPSVIIVEVLGYGGGDGGPANEDDESRRRARDQRSYNPNSPYQVIGLGSLTEEQTAALAAEKRAERTSPVGTRR